MKKWISITLLVCMLLTVLSGCGQKAPADTPMPPAGNVEGKQVDQAFQTAYMDLTLALLQKTAEEKQDKNLLISPFSVQLALAMTANGAAGETLQQMETVLGRKIPLAELNSYLYDYKNTLAEEREKELKIANSVWFRDDQNTLQVNDTFLQDVSDYYSAEIYKRAFDETTVKEINGWVEENTDGMIPAILDKIDSDSMMYLINAIAFDAQWAEQYDEFSIREGSFTNHAGQEQTVSMMYGQESLYIEDDAATGFIKPYAGEKYGFAVLLPKEGTDVYAYLNALTAGGLAETLNDAGEYTVYTQMPKFSYEFDINMNDALKTIGMPKAFDPSAADFSGIGTSQAGNLYIGNVLHKTFIRVDGLGTQAGATTVVEIVAEGAFAPEEDIKEVVVDRPFVYMILDMESNLPVFIGCVTEITE